MLGLTLPTLHPQIPLSGSVTEPGSGALRVALGERAAHGLTVPSARLLKRPGATVETAVAEMIHARRKFTAADPIGNPVLIVETGEHREGECFTYSSPFDDETPSFGVYVDDEYRTALLAKPLQQVMDALGAEAAATFMAMVNDIGEATIDAFMTPAGVARRLSDWHWPEQADVLLKPDPDGTYTTADKEVEDHMGGSEEGLPLPSRIAREVGGGFHPRIWLSPTRGPTLAAKDWLKAGFDERRATRLERLMLASRTLERQEKRARRARGDHWTRASDPLAGVALFHLREDLATRFIDDIVNGRMEVGDQNLTLAVGAVATAVDDQSTSLGDPIDALAAHLDALAMAGELADLLE